ncbi:acyl-CoA dehydrogenase family protein [Sneathiella marina]|uniref:Acyl-CoA dehydrogenase family protein n=1 Tax=Sneathiella marina TaxID=2950108 RepID=A0ABY4W517_9PROT|nr:acyl-CoA dehydrogenase family protein [Sneathiella marina]USG61936.1 acyl-CoA dehydrogenase family protein [Sneathiella marina]
MQKSPRELTDLLNTVKEFAKRHIFPRRRELITATEFPADLWQVFAECGLAGLSIPAQYGGQGASYQTLSKAAHFLNLYGGVPGATMTFLAHWQIIKLHIVEEAEPSLKQQLLPLLAAGKATLSVAISEPKAGAHPKHLQTTADRVGDEFILNGEKAFLTNGPLAQYFIVLAITKELNARRSFSAVLVDAKTPGLERTDGVKIDFLHPCPHGGIRLQNCKVPVANLIGIEGEAFVRTSLRMRAIEDAVGAASHIGALACLLNDIIDIIPEKLAEKVGRIESQFLALDIVAEALGQMADQTEEDMEFLLHLQLGFRQQLMACGTVMDEIVQEIDLSNKPETALLLRDINKLHSIAHSAHAARLVKFGRNKLSLTLANRKI